MRKHMERNGYEDYSDRMLNLFRETSLFESDMRPLHRLLLAYVLSIEVSRNAKEMPMDIDSLADLTIDMEMSSDRSQTRKVIYYERDKVLTDGPWNKNAKEADEGFSDELERLVDNFMTKIAWEDSSPGESGTDSEVDLEDAEADSEDVGIA